MKIPTPPLHAMVAFVYVVQHKSFKKAAEQLCVTPSAVSHRIRVLENWLGLDLLERSTRSIELTDAGMRCFSDLEQIIRRIEEFSKHRVIRQSKTTITIQTTDSFAARWLIPRLAHFDRLYPDIGIKLVTYDFRENLHSSEADLGILFMCEQSYAQAAKTNTVTLLGLEKIFPVCNPDMKHQLHSSDPAELAHCTLIHDDNLGVSWDNWNEVAGQPQLSEQAKSGPHYNHSHLALRAAELGGGFALASNILVNSAIQKGLLVAPFEATVSMGCGYYLVQPKQTAEQEQFAPFTKWLTACFD